MPELVIDGDRRMIVAGASRLVFSWSGDRWAHALEHRGRGESSHRVLAVSVEGDPARDDPARVVSPAYQDLQFQQDGSTMQALLVGQSGPHHFSAVFAVARRVQGGGDGWPHADPPYEISINVDVADRCRVPVEALAGTYTIDARSDDLIEASTAAAAWDMGPHRLTFAATDPARVAMAEAGRRATQVQALAGLSAGQSTHRLLYTWHWDPDIRW